MNWKIDVWTGWNIIVKNQEVEKGFWGKNCVSCTVSPQ